MSATHEEQTLAAAYVLGALEPEERRAFEAHAANCPVCTDEIRSLRLVTAALARSVPQRTPRPELRSRVLNAVVRGAGDTPAGAAPRSQASWSGWLPIAAAVAFAVAAGAYAWQLQSRVRMLEARLETAERRASAADRDLADARRVAGESQSAMAVLAAPDLIRIELAGQPAAAHARARALWSRNRGMVFTATDLPRAPGGRVYQVWVVTAGGPISAGLLTPDAAGRAEVFFNTPADIPPPTAIAVTLESEGGVPAPTGERYLVGTPG